MRGVEWKILTKWPLLVYEGIEFGEETNNRTTCAYEERMGKRNSMCVRVCVSESVEGPIASCDYLARSLVPGVGALHTNVHVGEVRRWRRGYERFLTL